MDADYTLHCGPNDGISRGDREDTGDLEARPTGSSRASDELDDLSIASADDARLGLTNIGGKGPDDWAADTGPTATNEGHGGVVTTDLKDRGSTLTEHGQNQPSYEDRLGEMPLGSHANARADGARRRAGKPPRRR
ncbi:MAG TPA: hypothetical protein VFL57_22510 [Bryobacteraceae bacterium]|nr:hypothetical protein [Bryobacteraceae bacterium]